MINNLDTDRMLDALLRDGFVIDINPEWDAEEYGNYIIHQFNLHFLPVNGMNYKQEQEIAKIVYSLRKSRNQEWKSGNNYA